MADKNSTSPKTSKSEGGKGGAGKGKDGSGGGKSGRIRGGKKGQ